MIIHSDFQIIPSDYLNWLTYDYLIDYLNWLLRILSWLFKLINLWLTLDFQVKR